MAATAAGSIVSSATPEHQGSLRAGKLQVRITTHMRMLALILLLMSVAAINYQSNAGWALVMLLVSIIVISILHARRNLALVQVVAGSIPPTFAGTVSAATVTVTTNGVSSACDITIAIPELGTASGHCALVAANSQSACAVAISARRRGVTPVTRVRVSTTYPLGLIEISREVPLHLESVVYPAAAGHWPLPAGTAIRTNVSQQQQGGILNQGADDFLGHRRYSAGDSRRQIDWKAHARGVPLMIKRFTGTSSHELWCDWDATRGGDEERLSQLARWVLEADQNGSRFGLRLPSRVLPPGQGVSHFQTCMRLLAEQPRFA